MFEGDLLEERARITPDRLALVSVETGRRLTYRELNTLAERAAAINATILESGQTFENTIGIQLQNLADTVLTRLFA